MRSSFDTNSFRQAVTRAWKKANTLRDPSDQIPSWFPNRIRHSKATLVRTEFGLDAAQVILGHARADTTEIYAETSKELALKITEDIG